MWPACTCTLKLLGIFKTHKVPIQPSQFHQCYHRSYYRSYSQFSSCFDFKHIQSSNLTQAEFTRTSFLSGLKFLPRQINTWMKTNYLNMKHIKGKRLLSHVKCKTYSGIGHSIHFLLAQLTNP